MKIKKIMKRRKLFSDMTTRRRLFSDSPRRKLFEDRDHILVCRDCGHEIEKEGATTNLYCPNCGSVNRFYVKSDNCECKCKPRRSLFSSLTRRYPNPHGEGQNDKYGHLNTFKCYDCGEVFDYMSRIPRGVVCPKCGGLRVVQLEDVIYDKEQHGKSDATDELLKEVSGKEFTKEELEDLLAEHGIHEDVDYFINSGYASVNTDNGKICFKEGASLTRKLFSELVISVTKELHLVPTENHEEMIHGLEERGNITPKGIVIIKRAHGMIPERRPSAELFSSTDSYIQDSGIANDLKLEYSGKSMPLKEFMEILNTQYNDAPDDLLDRLVETGVVKITGSQVEIN